MIVRTLTRSLVARLLGWLRPRPFERILVVGATSLAHRLIETLDDHPRYTVLGVLDDSEDAPTPLLQYHRLGTCWDLHWIVEFARPDCIVVALRERRRRIPAQELLSLQIKGIRVEEGTEMYERLTGQLAIETLTPSHLLFCRSFCPATLHECLSRVLSLVVATAGLALLTPVFILIALAIKLDSCGPVFFIQERAGLSGRPFRLIKFRTMHPSDAPVSEWEKDNGNRITRVGRWLRKFRLDELPQFVNILRGDMNLVGPRPHPVANAEMFALVARNTPECGEPIPYYAVRCLVRPGVTGWAQVRYRYANDLEEEIEKLRYDLYYVAHKSIWLDLRILIETARIVLLGRGAGDASAGKGDRLTTRRPSGSRRLRASGSASARKLTSRLPAPVVQTDGDPRETNW